LKVLDTVFTGQLSTLADALTEVVSAIPAKTAAGAAAAPASAADTAALQSSME
jgi:hypothetical protein